MIIVRNPRYRKVTFAKLWEQSQEPDSGLSRFLSVHFNLHIMLSSKFVYIHESHLLFTGLVELCFPAISGTWTSQTSFLGSYKSYDGKVPFLSTCQSPALCHPSYSPSLAQNRSKQQLSSLHSCPSMSWDFSRARLEWISCSASGRVELLTDFWMVLPATYREQGLMSEWQVRPAGGSKGSKPSLLPPPHWAFHALGILLWSEGFSSTMIYMPPTLKKNVKWFTIRHV